MMYKWKLCQQHRKTLMKNIIENEYEKQYKKSPQLLTDFILISLAIGEHISVRYDLIIKSS